MHIYFVRHGETKQNKAEVHQNDDAELTELGLKQAHFLAESLKRFPIKTIVASPLKRAKDTAEIIQQIIDKPLSYSMLLREIPYPSEIWGEKYNDPEAVRIRQEVSDHSDDPTWHYSDEENLTDTIARGRKAIDHLGTYNEGCILAVTHGRFLRVLVAYMLYDGNLNAERYIPIARFFETTNTGITIVEKQGNDYRLLTWNDYAHLGEIEKE